MKLRILLRSIIVLTLLSPAFAQSGGSAGASTAPDLTSSSGRGTPAMSPGIAATGNPVAGKMDGTEESPETLALLEDYSQKPSGRRAAELGASYFGSGNYAEAADFYLKAAEAFRRKKERARAYFNAATAVIEANRAIVNAAATGEEKLIAPPPLQSAVDYLHRCLDMDPGNMDAAFNMEVAKIMLARQQDEQAPEDQEGKDQEGEEQEKKDSGDQQDEGEGGDGESSDSGQPPDSQAGEQDEQNTQPGDFSEADPRESGEAETAPTGSSDEKAEDEESGSQAAADSVEESESLSEEELQERLSEILGSEEENRQLREALMEKRGGISDVERDW